MLYQLNFLSALALTVLIETLLLIILFRIIQKEIKQELKLIVFAGIIASVATLPYLWFIAPYFIKTKIFYHVFCELFAVLAESLIYYFVLRIGYLKALVYSLICNGVSYIIGLLVF